MIINRSRFTKTIVEGKILQLLKSEKQSQPYRIYLQKKSMYAIESTVSVEPSKLMEHVYVASVVGEATVIDMVSPLEA